MDDSTQQRIDKLTTIKTNLKNKIQNTLGKNLSNVKFEDYYRYITNSDSLNPVKTYSSMSNDIAGRLIRVNEIKQNIKEAIEDNFNANLSNVSFENYHNYIKAEYSLKSLKEPTFYQGWQYRVQVLMGSSPVGSEVEATFNVSGNNYMRTTDANGVVALAINLNPGTYTIKTTCQGKTLSETLVVKHASQTRTAGTTQQFARVGGRSRAWNNLTVANLEVEEPNNYATCPNLASQSGTYNTPYSVNLQKFGFTLPSGSTIYRADHSITARLSKNVPSNPQFSITVLNFTPRVAYTTGTATLLASKGSAWQYFTPSTININNFTADEVNGTNFTTRLEWSTNENGNVGNIYWTHYHLTIYYSPPQNI